MSDRLAIALDRERRGIVERVTNPDDRRVTLVTLTDEGRALLDAAAPAHVDAVRSLVVDVLDPTELVALAALSRRVAGPLNPANDSLRPTVDGETTRDRGTDQPQ
ncbi:MAG: hypothetical protein AAGA37_19170 [Actinomycetota bacterium]